MHGGIRDLIATNKTVLYIDTDVVFITKGTLTILFSPGSIGILLGQAMRLLLPTFGNLSLGKFLLLFLSIMLLGNWNHCGIYYLTPLSLLALVSQVPIKLIAQTVLQ